MTSDRTTRRWLPAAAFLVLAGSWYGANLLAAAAALRSLHAADTRIVAVGHEPMFTGLPSVWGWQAELRPMALGLIAAAIVAVLARRASKRPWFLLAALLPLVLGHGDRFHGWWAPGAGIETWTYGAGIAVPGLDLSHFGAGPAWTLGAGTLLSLSVVLAPAALVRASPVERRQQVLSSLPYLVLLSAVAAVVTGAMHVDSTGDGSSSEMLIAAAAAPVIAAFAVSSLHQGAMTSTKVTAFAAAAALALVGAGLAHRSHVAARLGAREPEPLPQP